MLVSSIVPLAFVSDGYASVSIGQSDGGLMGAPSTYDSVVPKVHTGVGLAGIYLSSSLLGDGSPVASESHSALNQEEPSSFQHFFLPHNASYAGSPVVSLTVAPQHAISTLSVSTLSLLHKDTPAFSNCPAPLATAKPTTAILHPNTPSLYPTKGRFKSGVKCLHSGQKSFPKTQRNNQLGGIIPQNKNAFPAVMEKLDDANLQEDDDGGESGMAKFRKGNGGNVFKALEVFMAGLMVGVLGIFPFMV